MKDKSLDTLLNEREEVYKDCVCFNDCSICPHKYHNHPNYNCKLSELNREIDFIEKEKAFKES